MSTDILPEIVEMVKDLVGVETTLYFDEALQVKLNPHTLPYTFWGVVVRKDGALYVMDGSQHYEPVYESDTLIVNSLYQRVAIISVKYKTAI